MGYHSLMDDSKIPTNEQQGGSQTHQVARSTAIMSAATLVSRVTGFIRTWAMAFALGNTFLAAGFSLGNNLPNMIYELVAGGVLSAAFLPIYLQQRNLRGSKASNAYANNLLSVSIVLLGAIALVASIFSPQVIVTQSLFSSASNETVEAATWLFRFFAFQIVFYGMSAIFSGLLNAERAYFWPAISSIFMNIVTIATFFGYPFVSGLGTSVGLTWLGAGTTLSVALMAFVQIPALRKSGFRFRFFIDLHGEGLLATVKLALPAIACTAINLVALSFMNSCALHVAVNGPSSISYAWMWYQFPYGVLSVALSTALFTEMSESTSRQDWDSFRQQVSFGLKATWALIIPMAAMVFACSWFLVGLYAAGKFTVADIGPIAGLLCGWAVALPLYSAYMFIYRAYSSMKDLKTVALCNLFLTIVQVLLYMVFTGVIDTGGRFEFGLLGLAMGDIVFYGSMLTVLLVILHRRVGNLHLSRMAPTVVKVSAASLVGMLVAKGLGILISGVCDTSGAMGNLIALICAGIPGLLVIYALCLVLRVEEVRSATARIRNMIGRRS